MRELDSQISNAQDMLTSHHYNKGEVSVFWGGVYDIYASNFLTLHYSLFIQDCSSIHLNVEALRNLFSYLQLKLTPK
jgi:hypothetical protein